MVGEYSQLPLEDSYNHKGVEAALKALDSSLYSKMVRLLAYAHTRALQVVRHANTAFKYRLRGQSWRRVVRL